MSAENEENDMKTGLKTNPQARCAPFTLVVTVCKSRSPTVLRVEFLLKTDSGYPRDAEVTLFTLANPEHSLHFNTHWSAPSVSALARSGGPRKMSLSFSIYGLSNLQLQKVRQ